MGTDDHERGHLKEAIPDRVLGPESDQCSAFWGVGLAHV